MDKPRPQPKKPIICYTLSGSQPYVLTAKWPEDFFKKGFDYLPDQSMSYVSGYSQTYCPYDEVPNKKIDGRKLK